MVNVYLSVSDWVGWLILLSGLFIAVNSQGFHFHMNHMKPLQLHCPVYVGVCIPTVIFSPINSWSVLRKTLKYSPPTHCKKLWIRESVKYITWMKMNLRWTDSTPNLHQRLILDVNILIKLHKMLTQNINAKTKNCEYGLCDTVKY